MKKQYCPVCRQPMTWFGDHWKCVNYKLHVKAWKSSAGAHPGPGRGKKRKGKK